MINNITERELNIIEHIAAKLPLYEAEVGVDLWDNYFCYEEQVDETVAQYLPTHELVYGATKYVIISDELSVVIKAPFNGAFDDNGDFVEFSCANDLDNRPDLPKYDYCINEWTKYEAAVAAGFGEFFAKTDRIGGVYIQEYVTPLNDTDSWEHYSYFRSTAKPILDSYNLDEKVYRLSYAWITQAIEYYGEERTIEFLKYIIENNLEDDLHDNNVGFDMAGKPIVLDWGGFRDFDI